MVSFSSWGSSSSVLSRGGVYHSERSLLRYNMLGTLPRNLLGGNPGFLAPLKSLSCLIGDSSWWGSWLLGRLQGTHHALWSPGGLLSGCSLDLSHHIFHLFHFLNQSFYLLFPYLDYLLGYSPCLCIFSS